MGDRLLVAGLALLLAAPVLASERCTLQFDQGQQLELPVVRTEVDQAKGLSGRADPSPGMLFVWEVPAPRSFWMKDTPAALDAAWIGADGRVQSVQTMQPDTLDAHSSLRPVIAVIEVPAGGLGAQGITRGSRVTSSTCFPVVRGVD